MPPKWRPDLGQEIAQRVFPTPDPFARDPVGWIETRLNAEMWSAQKTIARTVAEHRRTAVPSAHGCGKDWVAAALVAWWLDTQPDPFVVSAAPTSAQLGGILWREIARLHARCGLPGTVTTGTIPTWRIGEELRGWGRKPADLANPEEAAAAFSGIHSRSPFVILDEASGIPDWLWDAAATLMTSDESRLLAIGNPLDPGSRFARVCAPGSGFEVLPFSVFDTPAFTGEHVGPDLAAVLPSETWVEERRADWGEGSPAWIARVEGRFPPASRDTLIAPHLIADAQARTLSDDGDPRLGADIARGGADHTCVAACWPSGRVRVLLHERGDPDAMVTAGWLLRLLREDFGRSYETTMAVDTGGLGGPVFDRLREQNAPVTGFNSSERAHDRTRFGNRRAECFWRLREQLEAGAVDLDEHDDRLAAQLASLRWKVGSDGRIFIESKDAMNARGLPSPDAADSVMMTMLPSPAIGKYVEQAQQESGSSRRRVTTEEEFGGPTTEELLGPPRRPRIVDDDSLPTFPGLRS